MFIRSQRLFLRPAFADDGAAVRAAIGDSEIAGRLAHAPWPYGAGDGMLFLRAPRDRSAPQFLATLPDLPDAPVIGGCGLSRSEGLVELNYWIGPQWRGHGFATEAVIAVLEVAHMLRHKLVTAAHFLDNPASARVLHKAGFRATGEIVPRMSFARGFNAPAARYVGRPHDLAVHSEKVMGEGILVAA